jgi:protein-S-isoprenylcysteine O-methyltransferase Ste14
VDLARRIIGILIVISIPPAVLFWFVIHPFARFWRRLGAAVTYSVVLPLFVALVIVLYQVRDVLLGDDLGTNWLLFGIGFLFYALSVFIALKCRRYLRFTIFVGVPEVSRSKGPGRLLTEGIYGRVRHPRYLSVITGMIGFALIANYLGVYVMVLILLPVMFLLTIVEERELVERFGDDYLDYRRRVSRLIPRRASTSTVRR